MVTGLPPSQTAITYDELSSRIWALWKSPESWRNHVTVQFADVNLVDIQPAGSWTNPAIVQAYADALEQGNPIAPPVVSWTEQNTYYIHDGNHRYEAILDHLGPEVAGAKIRVALVIPNERFEFRQVGFPTFSTYLLLSTGENGRARHHNELAKLLCSASVTVV